MVGGKQKSDVLWMVKFKWNLTLNLITKTNKLLRNPYENVHRCGGAGKSDLCSNVTKFVQILIKLKLILCAIYSVAKHAS